MKDINVSMIMSVYCILCMSRGLMTQMHLWTLQLNIQIILSHWTIQTGQFPQWHPGSQSLRLHFHIKTPLTPDNNEYLITTMRLTQNHIILFIHFWSGNAQHENDKELILGHFICTKGLVYRKLCFDKKNTNNLNPTLLLPSTPSDKKGISDFRLSYNNWWIERYYNHTWHWRENWRGNQGCCLRMWGLLRLRHNSTISPCPQWETKFVLPGKPLPNCRQWLSKGSHFVTLAALPLVT